ncbi:MAG: protease complex subunit PrcB family protein [Elusimicrobia bacterium]|nr:protease complex subunit PrcB family protein [Elusimicrobiota bacterium]
MDCNKIREKISLYIDDKLSGNELSGFEEHISKCNKCARILEETRQAVKIVSGVPKKSLPVGFYQRLNRKLDGETEKITKPVPAFNWNYLMRGVATAIVVVIAFISVKEMIIQQVSFKSTVTPSEQQILKKEITESEKKTEPVTEPKKEKSEKKDITAKPKVLPGFESEVKVTAKGFSGGENYDKLFAKKTAADIHTSPAPADKYIKTEEKNTIAKSQTEMMKRSSSKEKKGLALNEKTYKKESTTSVHATKELEKKSEEIVHEPKEWYGYYSGYKVAGTKVFTNNDSWENFWQEHTKNQIPAPRLPVVDFNKEMAVAVFMGEQKTGGYAIQIVNIEKIKNKIIVRYKETVPSKNTAVTEVITQPYHIKVIEKSDLPVVFKKID